MATTIREPDLEPLAPEAVIERSGKPPKRERLLALDVFRGMTVAGMLLVNNPGTWGAIYPPLEHAEWHGWTPTDLIFPFFLFIAGVTVTYFLAKDGHEVTLLEEQEGVGRDASAGNAGIIAPGHSFAWA